MITDKDIDGILTMAELNVKDDVEAAIREYYRPDVEQEATVMWSNLPDSFKRIMKRSHPEAVEWIEGKMKLKGAQ